MYSQSNSFLLSQSKHGIKIQSSTLSHILKSDMTKNVPVGLLATVLNEILMTNSVNIYIKKIRNLMEVFWVDLEVFNSDIDSGGHALVYYLCFKLS